MVDVKKLLEDAKRAADTGAIRPWTAKNVKFGAAEFGEITVNGPQDTQDFLEAVRLANEMEAKIFGTPAGPVAPVATSDAAISEDHEDAELAAGNLAEEIERHIAWLQRRKLSPDTITESRHSLRLLLGVCGDVPLSKIKRNQILAFWDAVRWLPSRASVRPEYRDLSFDEAVAKGRAQNVSEPADATFDKHHQRLGVFFNTLVKQDGLRRSPLFPYPGRDTSKDMATGRPFSDEELARVFDPDGFTAWAESSPHRWWGPILGLHTGARVNEVAQLYLDDVRQIDGTWGIFFWQKGDRQKIKTQSSIRFVPLAQAVMDAGFLDFLEDMKAKGHPRLFPHLPAGTKKDGTPNGLGYGRQLSRQFGVYLDRLGIEEGVRFHAFRHTLSSALAEARVDINVIAKITGHAKSHQVPVLEKHYIHIADPKTLPERIAAVVAFAPGVALPIYTRGQFKKAFARGVTLHP